ncbi:MAG: preprotein translocase subunit SecG [bacterium]|nr:preprotein translocase subunit SecG [bacterium]
MQAILIFIHIVVCILMIVTVLMQASKGGGLSGAFGGAGGGMNAAFGGRGAGTFLTKATTILAIIFMVGAILQVFVSKNMSTAQRSLIQQELNQQPAATTSPAANIPGVPVTTGDQSTTTNPDTTR